MVCDLNHRLAISEASVGRKRSCGQLTLKVRGWVVFAIRWTRCFLISRFLATMARRRLRKSLYRSVVCYSILQKLPFRRRVKPSLLSASTSALSARSRGTGITCDRRRETFNVARLLVAKFLRF